MTDKTKADWLREFADAMEKDPDGWFMAFEYREGDPSLIARPESGNQLLYALSAGCPIRRRPRTVTRFDRHGERVELPEPLRERPKSNQRFYVLLSLVHIEERDAGTGVSDGYLRQGQCFASHSDAQAWADYFRSLLEGRDDD